MIIKIRRGKLKILAFTLLNLLLLFFILLGVPFTIESVLGLNVTNATVIARVNISNTEPNIYLVSVTYPANPIDLTANGATIIICNGSVQDINGYLDIKNVSATFYDNSVLSSDADDNNTHYTNSTCGPCASVAGTSNQNATCSCQFAVQYYANPASWRCNMSVNDSGGIFRSQNSSLVTINEVLGISVENSIMDYGNMSVSQVSNYIRNNVTNGGNIPINLTLRGFGGGDEEVGRNVTMICEAGANITFGNQRYYPGNNTAFGDMFNLTNQTLQVFNLTIPSRTVDTGLGNSSNATFWKLQVPLGVSGICNGTIIFGAVDGTLT